MGNIDGCVPHYDKMFSMTSVYRNIVISTYTFLYCKYTIRIFWHLMNVNSIYN